MANCPDNPVIPDYFKDPPVINERCQSCGSGNADFFAFKTSNRGVKLFHQDDITVQDISTAANWEFIIGRTPIEALTVVLTMIAKALGVSKSNPVLWGTTIDEIDLTWEYNHDVVSQELSNDGGITDPVPEDSTREYDYTGLTINNNNTSFTVTGDDSAGSEAQDIKSVIYGNYRVWGVGQRYDYDANNGGAPFAYSSLKTFLEDLLTTSGTKELTTTRVKNIYGEGGNLEHFYYFFPKSWGFATFTKYNFVGGFIRLKRNATNQIQVADNFESLDSGEQDILINNGLADDAFLVYMSLNDNIEDPIEPIHIT